jgi:hypothetical protein
MTDGTVWTMDVEAARELAEVVPTHEAGEAQTAAGQWVTLQDALAWHEAGHAIVYAALGRQVELVTIDPARAREAEPGRSANVANGTCKTSAPRDSDPLDLARQTAVGSLAGVVAAMAVRVGLGLALATTQERFSHVDEANFEQAKAMFPEAGLDYPSVCLTEAFRLLREHRDAYGRVVQALLTRRTLEREDFAAEIVGTSLAP